MRQVAETIRQPRQWIYTEMTEGGFIMGEMIYSK
jgi:hypothetical protein